jgi:hypothetical protein
MRLGGALLLIALGAVLKFAVTLKNDHGFNVNVIGVILMIVGAVWLLAELAYGFSRRRTDVVHHGVVEPVQHTTYVEPPANYR